MARRRLLTREALARQLDPPADEREIARHFTLTREDLDWGSIRRGPASQLGYAMTLLYMRWPGRVLGSDETPPAAVLSFVARRHLRGATQARAVAVGDRHRLRYLHRRSPRPP